MPNGKTIGRERPPRDARDGLDHSQEQLVAFEADAAERSAQREHAGKLSSDHRYAIQQNATLTRELAVARARLETLLKGGDPFNAMKPIGAAHEREAEFERVVLSMEDMTPEARLKHISKLIEDTKGYVERREAWKKSIENIK